MKQKITIAFIFIFIVFYTIITSCQGQSNVEKPYSLSGQDAETIKSIINFSIISMDTVSEEMHINFWKVVQKNGGNPNNIKELGSKEKIKEFIRETGISYQKAFYEDALISLRTGVKPLVRMILPAILKPLLKKLMTYLIINY